MNSDHPQEHNLLYIALTRSTQSLMLLLNRRTKHIVSPFVPIELVHYAMEMWGEAQESRTQTRESEGPPPADSAAPLRTETT